MAKIDLVRRPSLISPRHLLHYIFFTEAQVEQASKILNTIMKKDGVVKDSDWEIFKISSRGLYVKVMRKLRDVGLVEKRMGEFRLAEDFSKAMTKLADYWSQIVKSFGEGDRSIKF
ncbi:MAG: hypothetical protein EAX87_11995 [Candidatus Thorarchaeota archaeon]|jgi:hypothetical protein|nr:hypothetical protein [Candidatus Thorarchaeota archaeon]